MFDPWSSHASTLREKLMEHVFLGDLLRELMGHVRQGGGESGVDR